MQYVFLYDIQWIIEMSTSWKKLNMEIDPEKRMKCSLITRSAENKIQLKIQRNLSTKPLLLKVFQWLINRTEYVYLKKYYIYWILFFLFVKTFYNSVEKSLRSQISFIFQATQFSSLAVLQNISDQ